MHSKKSEKLLMRIGVFLAQDKVYPLNETLFYAEVDTGYIAPSIFTAVTLNIETLILRRSVIL